MLTLYDQRLLPKDVIAISPLFSRETFLQNDLPYVETYLACVEDIIDTPQVRRLAAFNQHMLVSRLAHSLGVSYYSFLICHAWGLNYRAAARGGLLHDLFFDKEGIQDDFEESPWEKGWLAFTHPRQALKNARKLTALTPLEEEIIVKHMFPLGGISFRWEAQIVSLVDKCCATTELFASASLALQKRVERRRARAAAK